MLRCLILVWLALAGVNAAPAFAESEWQVLKGKHFLVYYRDDPAFAESVRSKAETYYRDIADDMGFSRRGGFWLWEDRVSLYIYPTREEYLRATGAPEWSGGKARYREKEIASFHASDLFLNSILPHEIAHIILRDYLALPDDPPLWLNEGTAQWVDRARRPQARQTVGNLCRQNRLIPFPTFVKMRIEDVDRSNQAYVFYAQASSVVGYLIEEYGPEAFRKLCSQFRAGKDLDAALRFTYPGRFATVTQLEKAWIAFVKERACAQSVPGRVSP
jgi:hypothetical protein